MVALLVGGTYFILSQVIDRVADRHISDLTQPDDIALKPGLDEDGRPSVRSPAEDTAVQIERERQALRGDFMTAFFNLAFMISCSFGVPAILVLWRGWQKKRGDDRINFLVRHDASTGLFNRASFAQALDDRLSQARSGDGIIALHFVDIDRFKTINDTLGHGGGDELIASVAARLAEAAGTTDVIGRLGGDEFVLAQCGIESPDTARAKADEIKARLSRPFRLGGHDVSITASIGVAVAPRDGSDAIALMHAADTAMSCAKADGRDAIRLYAPEMDVKLQVRRTIEEALRRALDTRTFFLNFQPVFGAKADKLIGFEALLRLHGADETLIPPTDFIPIAEEMGIITRIGSWVIEEACRVAAGWPDDLIVAVNLSPRQLDDDDICGVVTAALAQSGLPAHRLELEITEGVLLRDTEAVLTQLGKLKSLGISIAMDDFGTGYSSLSNLWRFPFDKLKIDRSFMSNLGGADENMLNILKTIVSLGRTLKLQVTAEGIETQAQADLLKSLNCDQLQGYLYGRPMAEEDVVSIIRENIDAALETNVRPSYTYKGEFATYAA